MSPLSARLSLWNSLQSGPGFWQLLRRTRQQGCSKHYMLLYAPSLEVSRIISHVCQIKQHMYYTFIHITEACWWGDISSLFVTFQFIRTNDCPSHVGHNHRSQLQLPTWSLSTNLWLQLEYLNLKGHTAQFHCGPVLWQWLLRTQWRGWDTENRQCSA